MTAGMRPSARSFFAPARRPSVRAVAFSDTDFMVFKLERTKYPRYIVCCRARLTGAPTLELKERSNRRITVDSFDGFAQKGRYRKRRNLYAINSRAKNGISCYQFVNSGFS